ncbi:unnamed protein product [Lactuca saligna]|uniref:Uncharacterized protein n=1 Tax=Lactuca saligna TaxID=75948 RepID=A0AA36A541_LACSI|nr:unnamed protein product [Lactuca saligna]
MDSNPSVPRFDNILDGSKYLEDFKENIDFLFKSYSYLKSTIDHVINQVWNQFPNNKEILEYADKRNVEFNQLHQNIELSCDPELKEVQLDQLSLTYFLDHPRVQEQSEVLTNTNELLEDHSIEPSKILSHPIVSNQVKLFDSNM